jgi:hypothetical protein
MGDEQTTESEDRKEKDAAEAAERIKRGQHWLDWMYIAAGLEVGRVKAMRRAETNRPIGSAYNRAFGDWLNERSWARDLDKPTRNHLFWCADNRNNIEAWRETLAPNERARLNHPTALKRRYEATHKVVKTKGVAPKPQKVAHEQEVERLKAAVEMRDREIEWLKTKRAEDGSLFDIAKTKTDQIARIVLENVGLARTRNIRNALTQAIESTARKARAKPKQAG